MLGERLRGLGRTCEGGMRSMMDVVKAKAEEVYRQNREVKNEERILEIWRSQGDQNVCFDSVDALMWLVLSVEEGFTRWPELL